MDVDGQLENRSVADIVELPVGWLYWIMAWPIRIEQRSWLDGQASDLGYNAFYHTCLCFGRTPASVPVRHTMSSALHLGTLDL